MHLLVSWIILTFAVYVTAYILPGVSVTGVFPTVVTAMFIGIVNTFLRPVLLILTLPVNILTLGLFTFVINALLVLLVAAMVPDFHVDGFWWAMAFSIILSIVNGFLSSVVRQERVQGGGCRKKTNPKHEILNLKQTQMTKIQIRDKL